MIAGRAWRVGPDSDRVGLRLEAADDARPPEPGRRPAPASSDPRRRQRRDPGAARRHAARPRSPITRRPAAIPSPPSSSRADHPRLGQLRPGAAVRFVGDRPATRPVAAYADQARALAAGAAALRGDDGWDELWRSAGALASAAVILRLTGVSVRRAGRTILGPLDWPSAAGERWVVLGPNGSGKTTLVQVASTYLWPTTGAVEVLGETIGRVDARELRRRIGYAGAGLEPAIDPAPRAVDVVMTARHAALGPWWHEFTDADRDRAARLLDESARRRSPTARSGRSRPASAAGSRSPGR